MLLCSMAEQINRSINIFLNEQELQTAFDRLQSKAAKLEKQIQGAANPKAQQQFSAELDKTRNKMQTLSDQIAGKVNPSIKQMEQATRKAWNELQNMPVGTAEWKSKLAEFDKLNGHLIKTKGEVGAVGRAMRTFADEVKTVATGVLVGNTLQAVVQGISGYISGMVSGAAKLSDELTEHEPFYK